MCFPNLGKLIFQVNLWRQSVKYPNFNGIKSCQFMVNDILSN